ncbi:MAG: hypothetical protein B6A08_04230 [Sorangiineae bacterium NIC37A_2]|nr:MAG: hypothetical protein B6A08_04230 [Sorangiineae bacterium NIC37A_2]
MFHERDHGPLGGRICGVRRQEAVDLVEDDERFELTAAGQTADPGQDFLEHHTEHERALFVVEVRHAQDDARRSAVFWLDPFAHVQACPLAPARKGRRREKRVQGGRETEPLALFEECIDRQRANRCDRWIRKVLHEHANVSVTSRDQAALSEDAEQHVFLAPGRIRIASEQAQDEADRRAQGVARRLRITVPAGRAALEGREHVELFAGGRAWRDDAQLG